MASVQCYKPAEQTCCNKQHLLDPKVSETASWEIKKETSHNGLTETQTQCYKQTQAYYYNNGAEMDKSHVHCFTQSAHASGTGSHNGHKAHVGLTSGHKADGHAAATNNSGMACQGKTSRWKKDLLQKIKDGISGHRDVCDSSSSSGGGSESDSDNEKCGKRKN